jgi:hypothetical protein
MVLLVLSIDLLQNIMDLLVDVLNPLNEFGGFVSLSLNMGIFYLCVFKRQCNINGTQGLESHPHLKWDMASGAMNIHVVVVLNIENNIIPCMWILKVVHVHVVQNHLIDDLCMVIGLRVERNGFSEIGVQQ